MITRRYLLAVYFNTAVKRNKPGGVYDQDVKFMFKSFLPFNAKT